MDKYPQGKIFWLVCIYILGWMILLNLGKEKASGQELALASVTYFLSCLPTLIYFRRRERNIPFLPIFAVIYFVSYAYPIFNNYNFFLIDQIGKPEIIKSLILNLLGLLCLYLAFYTPLGSFCQLLPHLKIHWFPAKAFRLAVVLGILGLLVDISPSGLYLPSYFEAIILFLSRLPLLSIAILFILQLKGNLSPGGKVFLWGIFMGKILLDLSSTGATLPFLLDLILLIAIYIQQRQKIPWVGIVIAGLIFVVVFGVRDEFRYNTSYEGPYASASPIRKSMLYFQLIKKNLFAKQKISTDYYDKLSARTNNLVLFSKVVYLTPDRIPYWNGFTYRTLLFGILPRFIVPDKPTKNVGQEFGHRYEFLYYTDYTTSINLPQLIEMYINFGSLGVFIGMFIVGLIYRSLYVLLNHPQSGEGGSLLGLMIFTNLLNIESDFSMVFGSLVQYIVLFYFIVKLMKAPRTKIPQ